MNACMLAYTFYESDNRVMRYAETLARRGDICYLTLDNGDKPMGVCLGRDTAMLQTEGLTFVPTLQCARAWRIG